MMTDPKSRRTQINELIKMAEERNREEKRKTYTGLRSVLYKAHIGTFTKYYPQADLTDREKVLLIWGAFNANNLEAVRMIIDSGVTPEAFLENELLGRDLRNAKFLRSYEYLLLLIEHFPELSPWLDDFDREYYEARKIYDSYIRGGKESEFAQTILDLIGTRFVAKDIGRILEHAATCGHLGVIRKIFSTCSPAMIAEFKYSNLPTAFSRAADGEDYGTLALLIKLTGTVPNYLFFHAIKAETTDFLHFLLEQGGDPDTTEYPDMEDEFIQRGDLRPDIFTGRHLIRACKKGKLDHVRMLIQYGASANPQHHENVLYEAVRSRNLELVKLLLDHGANVFKHKKNAFFWTARTNQLEMFKIMYPYAHATEEEKLRCLFWALEKKNLAFCKHILVLGIDPALLLGDDPIKRRVQKSLADREPEYHNLLREYVPEISRWFTSGDIVL